MAAVKNARVLVVDDESDVLFAIKMLLKTEVKQVVTEKNPENLLPLLDREQFDVIFLDMNFKSALNTGNEGIFWLKKILGKDPGATVVLITAYGDVELAVRSLKGLPLSLPATTGVPAPLTGGQYFRTERRAAEA